MSEAREIGSFLWHIHWSAYSIEANITGRTHYGYSISAGKAVDFQLQAPAQEIESWGENLVCPVTHLSSRHRAVYHVLLTEVGITSQSDVYCAEQIGPFYAFLRKEHPKSVGSEFLPDVELGQHNGDGIRSEDLTQLTFASDSFDALVTMEIFEHIPDYRAGLKECARVLRPGGAMVFTAPFHYGETTRIHARIVNGETIHDDPPEYHGDPLTKGILCYQTFGYDVLDEMRAAGFSDAYVAFYHAPEFGHLGGLTSVIVAVK